MGYTTTFEGDIEIVPALNAQEIEFLTKFAGTRRMMCKQGPYYVDRGGMAGQDRGPDIIDYNTPPEGQPGLWCQWIPNEDGTALVWDENEKFYEAEHWMAYLIEHFLGRHPLAKPELSFLQGHVLNGTIYAYGEESDDRWMLIVRDNAVYVQPLFLSISPDHPEKLVGGEIIPALGNKT